MDWLTPQMLEMVAVGAMAMVLELRMPMVLTRLRRLSQSSVRRFSTWMKSPRSSISSSSESMGRMPLLHSEPSKLA